MQSIRYPLHFLILMMMAGVWWLLLKSCDEFGAWLFFAGGGSFHAAAVVLSLKDRSAITAIKTFAFIASATGLSSLAPFSFVIIKPLFQSLTLDTNLFLAIAIAFASACGAATYWLLVRYFWLRSIRFINLVATISFCVAASILTWSSLSFWGDLMPAIRDFSFFSTIFGWWFAFSLSLYWGEL